MTDDEIMHVVGYSTVGSNAIAPTEWCAFARALLAASTSANVDRFDPYRLKVAEECCERLMSACTDAGCPDGVRMDDWIRENVRSTSANVAQGAEAVGLVMTNDKGEKYGALMDSNIEERTKLYTAPPAQTAITDDARDAARYRWLRDRTDTRDQKPFIAIMSAVGISMWNDTSADDAIDAALTAAGEPK